MKILTNLSASDRRALLLLVSFFIVLLLAWGVLRANEQRSTSMTAMTESRGLLLSIYRYGKRASQAERRASPKGTAGADQSLLALASESAKAKQLAFKRFQPEGDTQLKLWLEEVNFDVLLSWLSELEQVNAIAVESIAVEKTEKSGFVDVRLTLRR